MAKQTIKAKTTSVKVAAKSSGDRVKCNMCGGTGYHKKPTYKKK